MISPAILHEDEAILVIAKPAGMAVHGASEQDDRATVVSWLADAVPELAEHFPRTAGEIWRPGIVHRLDQDTSGVMVIAKTPEALTNLQDQFRGRTTEKVYRALVAGLPDESGELTGAIARSDADPTHQEIRRLTFSWSKGKAREAETTYRRLGFTSEFPPGSFHLASGIGKVENSYLASRGVSLVELHPKTGRMHQLRVQLAEVGWPILGDETYGTKQSQQLSATLDVDRQLLHAFRLSFDHPLTGERRTFSAPYPNDFLTALHRLGLPSDDDRTTR